MAVCFYETRVHFQSGNIQDIRTLRNLQIRADGRDFAGIHKDVCQIRFPVDRIIYKSVFYNKHDFVLPCVISDLPSF